MKLGHYLGVTSSFPLGHASKRLFFARLEAVRALLPEGGFGGGKNVEPFLRLFVL